MTRNERKDDTFQKKKNVSRPSNTPDELDRNVSKKTLSDELFLHFSSTVQKLTVFFNYSHDSNSIFRVGRINSENISARTVVIRYQSRASPPPPPPLHTHGHTHTQTQAAPRARGRTSSHPLLFNHHPLAPPSAQIHAHHNHSMF